MAPSELGSRSTAAPKDQPPDSSSAGRQKALPESVDAQHGSTDLSPSGTGDGPPASASSSVPGTSSNVVPRDTVVRTAISLAAAARALNADDVSTDTSQQGQWVTASFDDLPG